MRQIWSPLSRAEIVVGALTACRRATALSPWLCSEADYQERNAPIFAAISNAALRSTMPGSWRTEAILLTVAEAFLVLTFIFLVLSLLLEHKLRRDLLSSVPLRKLQKRQTRARHMAMYVAPGAIALISTGGHCTARSSAASSASSPRSGSTTWPSGRAWRLRSSPALSGSSRVR